MGLFPEPDSQMIPPRCSHDVHCARMSTLCTHVYIVHACAHACHCTCMSLYMHVIVHNLCTYVPNWPLPQADTPTPVGDTLTDNQYTSFTYKGVVHRLGNSVYLPINKYSFPVKPAEVAKKPNKHGVESDPRDQVKFPELYRKSEYIKGSNTDVPQPFQIGRGCGYIFTTPTIYMHPPLFYL